MCLECECVCGLLWDKNGFVLFSLGVGGFRRENEEIKTTTTRKTAKRSMESYPSELLVGVFPLVFCVDTTIPEVQEEWHRKQTQMLREAKQAQATTTAVNDFDHPNQAPTHLHQLQQQQQQHQPSSRSPFDKFLDAMASSLMDFDDDDHPLRADSYTSTSATSSNPRRKMVEDNNSVLSLFRGDDASAGDGYDSDQEVLSAATPDGYQSTFDYTHYFDDVLSPPGRRRSTSGGRKTSSSMGINFGRGLIGGSPNPMQTLPTASSNTPSRSTQTQHYYATTGGNQLDTSTYAKALQHGQGFFQRARIISIGKRHGFPPSKDPNGRDNRIYQFFQQKVLNTTKLIATANKRPIDGILTNGWLEKHAHALPSVLLVIVPITGNDKLQIQQDEQMVETLESLTSSLATKRECPIQIVGLIQEGVSLTYAEQWTQQMSEELKLSLDISLLDDNDIAPDAATTSVALRQLHNLVREASLQYYLTQARRTKEKLRLLGQARKTPLLLPLAIRYCFKVAIFYEFQWKHEKSLKFMAEAYRHVESYYRYLLERRRDEVEESLTSTNNKELQSTTTTTTPQPPLGETPPRSNKVRIVQTSGSNDEETTEDTELGESVEMTLGTPRNAQNHDEGFSGEFTPPPPPKDMVHQCRAVADWLNFKLLQAGFVSHTEGGLLAASMQWRRHAQVFTSPNSFVSKLWHDWSYVARQRVVISQLLERHPPRALGDLGNEFDEVLLRCSPWRTYEAAAEALLQVGAHVQRALNDNTSALPAVDPVDDLRTRYVGGLDSVGLAPKLQEEAKQNHRGRDTIPTFSH